MVPVYELGAFVDRRPYFTMKLVKGRTLADVLDARSDPAADRPRLLGIFLQVCQTVAYAHARGVIHRDLKPSNVMVGSFGEVQVMDWGLAKVLPKGGVDDDDEAGKVEVHETIIATARSAGSDSDLSQAGSVLGTPAYMAPEQARGEIDRVDERADVFALGSILCEILTGEPAFLGRSAGEIQRKAARGELADAFARLDACGADAELVAVAFACLAAEPEDRPREAGGVAAWLSSYLAGVQERLRAAELARAAESARAEEAQRTAAVAELARNAETARVEEAQARVTVERSRRRRTVALAASLLAMTTLGGLTFTYIAHERQARAAAVDRLLGKATTLLEEARAQPDDPVRWRTALAAVQQVEDDPGGIAPEVRDRLALLKTDATSGLRDAERDATLRQALVEVRANQQDAGVEATDAAYGEAFRAAGLEIDALSVPAAAERLKRRPTTVVVELAAYLDHWSDVRREAGRPATSWRKPLELARAADADDYRDRLRTLLASDDPRPNWLNSRPWPASCGRRAAGRDGGAARRRPGGRGRPRGGGGPAPPGGGAASGRRLGQLRFGRDPGTADAGAARGGGAVLHGGAGPAAGDGARPGPPARRDGPGRRGRGHLPRPGRPPAQDRVAPGMLRQVPEGPRPGRRGA